MTEEQTGKASLEELKRDALKHYEYVSAVAHYWSNLIPKAIEAYNPDFHTQFLSYLDTQMALVTSNDEFTVLQNVKEKYTQLINQP